MLLIAWGSDDFSSAAPVAMDTAANPWGTSSSESSTDSWANFETSATNNPFETSDSNNPFDAKFANFEAGFQSSNCDPFNTDSSSKYSKSLTAHHSF